MNDVISGAITPADFMEPEEESRVVMTIPLPPEIAHLRPDLERFTHYMIFKLAKNAHKGRWEDMDLASLFRRMVEEKDELYEAIDRGNMVEILLEAADVANFAMMIAAAAIEGKKE